MIPNNSNIDIKLFFKSQNIIDLHIMNAFRSSVYDFVNHKLRYSSNYISSINFHLNDEIEKFQKSLTNQIFLYLKKIPNANDFIINNIITNENLFVIKLNLYQDDSFTFKKDFNLLKTIKAKYDVQRAYYFVYLENGIDLPFFNIILNQYYLKKRLMIIKKKYMWTHDYLRLCVYSIKQNAIQNITICSNNCIIKSQYSILI